VNGFVYTTAAQRVMFGPGALSRLDETAHAFGWQRLMLCTSQSQQRNGRVDHIATILGSRLVTTYAEAQAHVPDFQVAEALSLAEAHGAQAIIGLGGGSPIGLAKAVSLALEARRAEQDVARAAFPTDQPLVPTIAIPTTYAGSEMTPIYGVTHQLAEGARKITVTDAKVTPKVALYDPHLTLDLPPRLTATTGINALAHAIEAVYAINRHPLSTAAALAGVGHISRALLPCFQEGGNITARTELMLGAHLAAVSLATVNLGVHHGTCHVLGGSAGVPHGIANCIILPHAMRFNLPVAAPQLAQVAQAMSLDVAHLDDEAAGETAVQAIYKLIGRLDVPQRLRDVGVAETVLLRLAQVMLRSTAVQNNPRPVDASSAEALLRAAW
jgi:maleylacetate reductase